VAKSPAGPPRRQAMQRGPSHQLGAARGRPGKLLATLACVRALVRVRAWACAHVAAVRAGVEALQIGSIHHRTRSPTTTVAKPSAAPSNAALKPERTRLGIVHSLQTHAPLQQTKSGAWRLQCPYEILRMQQLGHLRWEACSSDVTPLHPPLQPGHGQDRARRRYLAAGQRGGTEIS
jgi:hypothetical protein